MDASDHAKQDVPWIGDVVGGWAGGRQWALAVATPLGPMWAQVW